MVDRRWNLLRANAGARRLTEFLAGPPPADSAPAALSTWRRPSRPPGACVHSSSTGRRWRSTATLGTSLDVTLQEIRIECFFPVDEETAGV